MQPSQFTNIPQSSPYNQPYNNVTFKPPVQTNNSSQSPVLHVPPPYYNNPNQAPIHLQSSYTVPVQPPTNNKTFVQPPPPNDNNILIQSANNDNTTLMEPPTQITRVATMPEMINPEQTYINPNVSPLMSTNNTEQSFINPNLNQNPYLTNNTNKNILNRTNPALTPLINFKYNKSSLKAWIFLNNLIIGTH